MVASQAFIKLSQLSSLDISFNQIISLNGTLSTDLENLRFLNCRGNRISTIAEAPFKNLTKLQSIYLDENRITEISNDSFVTLLNLQLLSLNRNKLTSLNCISIYLTIIDLRINNNNISYIAQNCERLFGNINHKLDISYNNLISNGIELYDQILIKLSSKLTNLLLAGNNITAIPQSYFKRNPSLRGISLGNNNMSLSAIKQAIRGFYKMESCVSDSPTINTCYSYSIDLSNTNLREVPPEEFIHLNNNLKILSLNHNSIEIVDVSTIFRDNDYNLQELNLADNALRTITNSNNVYFDALRILNVAHNKLSIICGRAPILHFAPNLLQLYLDFNNVRILTNRCLRVLSKLQLLSIKSNPMATITESSFYGSSALSAIASTRPYLCCIVPAKITTCSPVPDLDSASSCENILAHTSLKLSVWIMAIAAFIGNILVIVTNRSNKMKKTSKSTELVFNSLALSDFLMSIYLIIIGVNDQIYNDRYAQYAEEWLKSPACIIASFLISTSSMMSVIMMLLISIDRYSITVNPFTASHVRFKRTKIALGLGWSVTCIYVAIPVIMSINQPADLRLYQFSFICSPSNLSHRFYATWTLSFVLIQLISWIITLVIYVLLLREVSKTRRSIRSNAQSRNGTIAIRLSLILVTDLAAWLPIYVISALGIIQGSINVFILQFAVILAIPLNSAINPYIYTATGTASFNRLVAFISKKMSSSSSFEYTSTTNINLSSARNQTIIHGIGSSSNNSIPHQEPINGDNSNRDKTNNVEHQIDSATIINANDKANDVNNKSISYNKPEDRTVNASDISLKSTAQLRQATSSLLSNENNNIDILNNKNIAMSTINSESIILHRRHRSLDDDRIFKIGIKFINAEFNKHNSLHRKFRDAERKLLVSKICTNC
ncbi:Relaxin receptor 2 [Trichoplax sp. H2]|nr:Relaxin receptor 2 [Trichoplax sp. H2]|eukprot:RDD42299.1 Relaxin receptor 2 [Trichoplax sp. H2]